MSRQQKDSGRDTNLTRHAKGRRVLSLALALLFPFVLAGPSVASAADEFAVGGGRSFASGRDYVQFAFAAHTAPDGTASGHIALNWPPGSTQPNSAHNQLLADVVCLVVVGNVATAYGVVTKVDNIDLSPDWVGISVADQPDTFLGFFGFGDPPCTLFAAGVYPLSEGNIVVHD